MKVVTTNLNGIRSASKKGFFNWLLSTQADVICIQELKAQQQDMTDHLLNPFGYSGFFQYAEKKGYSGVGIYTKSSPAQHIAGIGWPLADGEGRFVAVEYNNVWIASIYLPSGTSGNERQQIKFEFLKYFREFLESWVNLRPHSIFCGDWNIAHKEIDLKNWRNNQKNSGFLPEERAWLDSLFDEAGFIDAFRVVNQAPNQYTWWSNRGNAWANNVGWRIDYQILSPFIEAKVKSASIYKEERFSDHAPLVIEYDFD
jgi:exodeoxyribonuclease-3